MSLVCYLRNRKGLTQKALSEKCGLSYQEIRRAEIKRSGTLKAIRTIARFFGVSIDSIARNDFRAIADVFTAPPEPIYTQRDRLSEGNKIKDEVGRVGEALVAKAERMKLAGTKYVNLVNENCSDNLEAGFDIFSFTAEGKPVYIEVKTTKSKKAETPFFMSANEYEFLLRCVRKGFNYELHRVYAICDKAGWKRKSYTADEIIEMFDFRAQNFAVTPKGRGAK